ncbi:hypothetical protein [Gynuella sunshinyii]|uniref:hypothetical protein n=1 Tax=Gynuella sunshinyii TaxID=1445505 RepID=UPI0005CC56B7|nr:hypothetical protein [Gynuella sunshinyii]
MKLFLSFVLITGALFSAQIHAASYDGSHLSPVQLGGIYGVSYGGEEIGPSVTVNGNGLTSKMSVRSGNLYFWMARVAVNINPRGGMMIDLGRHWHHYDEDDGDVQFSRYRVSVIPFYRDHHSLRWGIGPTFDFDTKYQADLPSRASIRESFDSAFGIIADLSYDPLETFYTAGVRAQWINYQGSQGTNVSGSHIAVYIGIELDY